MREQKTNWIEGLLGCLLIVAIVSFVGLIHYSCNAYPKVWSAEQIDATHAKVVLYLGSYCDPPSKIISDMQEKNPQIEVEGYSISHAWNGDIALEIRYRKR